MERAWLETELWPLLKSNYCSFGANRNGDLGLRTGTGLHSSGLTLLGALVQFGASSWNKAGHCAWHGPEQNEQP